MITIVIISYQLTKSCVIIKLITLIDNKHLMANPFFSGRIPQSLYDKVEQYISESGKSKTELLISALSNYLDFPVEAKQTNSSNDELWIVVKELQERIEKLEQGSITTNVIIPDNKDITKLNTNPEQLSLLENTENVPENKEKSFKGQLLEINEILLLPGLEKLDSKKTIAKLRNARSQNRLPIQIEKYLIGDGGKNPNKSHSILWEIINDNK